MKSELFTSYGYLELSKLSGLIENSVRQKVHGFLEYEQDAIAKRLVQNLMVLLATPFLRVQTRSFFEGKGRILEQAATVLLLDDLVVNKINGEIKVSPRLFWRCTAKFIFYWLLIVCIWCISLIFLNSRKRKATLLYGIPSDSLKYKNSDKRFVDYCNHGPLKELQEVDLVVVESNQKINATQPDHFKYGRIPQLELLLSSRLNIRESLLFLKQHIRALFKYLCVLCLSPIYCLLWRDIAEHALTESLNAAGLIQSVIITNSAWHNQYLWMFALPHRRFKTYMALYSLNSHPFVYREDPIYVPYPMHRYLFVDIIWTWSEKYKEMLIRDKIMIDTDVKGPILWYLPEPYRPKENDEFKICVFDVTPRAKAWLLARYGSPFTYYDYDTVKRFYDDILSAVREVQEKTGKRISILVKRKRETNHSDDADYRHYLRKINEENENLSFVDHDDNLFTLIGGCDLSITIPFTSTAYVAKAINKPAIFYDPMDTLLFNHPEEPMVEFISDREKLVTSILSVIVKKSRPDK